MRRTDRTRRHPRRGPRSDADLPATLRWVAALNRRAERARRGLYLAEGLRNFHRCAQGQRHIECLLVSWKLLTNTTARQRVRALRRQGVRTILLSPEEFRRLSRAEHASGLMAVVRPHWTPARGLDPRDGWWILLRELRSPGNLGTLLRSLEAAGGRGLMLLGDAIDPFDPAVLRGSMGSLFGIELVRVDHGDLQRYAALGCSLLGICAETGEDHTRCAWPEDPILLLGCERKGMRPADAALCQRTLRIPLARGADSLNVGVAGSLLVLEARRAAALRDGSL